MVTDHPWPNETERGDLLPEGSVLKGGEYRLTGYLGAGAFGAVYLAEQTTIRRQVAIKVLKKGHDQNARDRFLLEAQAAASIEHPNIVHIYDYGVHEESQPFMVMERLRGNDLRDELDKNGALTAARALPLFIGCLDALGEAHRQAIVHKDLKPSNLFLVHPGTHRETLKIVDFGIARVGRPEEGSEKDQGSGGMTATGMSIGTPKYLAPEYVQDQRVTPAVDVYQMGLILAEALTNVSAVDGESWWSCALKHINGDLNLSVDLMSSPLGPVIRKATSTDPEARFPDAHAFMEALRQLPSPDLPAPLAAGAEADLPGTAQGEAIAPAAQRTAGEVGPEDSKSAGERAEMSVAAAQPNAGGAQRWIGNLAIAGGLSGLVVVVLAVCSLVAIFVIALGVGVYQGPRESPEPAPQFGGSGLSASAQMLQGGWRVVDVRGDQNAQRLVNTIIVIGGEVLEIQHPGATPISYRVQAVEGNVVSILTGAGEVITFTFSTRDRVVLSAPTELGEMTLERSAAGVF